MQDKFKRTIPLQGYAAQFLLGMAGLALVTYVCFSVGFGLGRTSFIYLILIALVSLLGNFSLSAVLSILAVACLNYFFVPPLFEFRVDDPEDIVRLAAFFTTSLVVSALINRLRASEMRFRSFVDHASDAFFLLDDQLRIVDVNKQACANLGYSRDELIGMHSQDFDSGLDDPSIQHLRQRIAAGETVTFETRHRRKDGTTFPVEVRIGDFEQAGKRRFLCLVRDIFERKQAEETLRRNETYLAAAESLSKMGSWAWRPAANEITHWSRGRYRLFGFDPADGVPSLEAVIERIHPEDRALWLENRSLVARGGESDFDFRIVLPDGGTKHIHAVGRPILNQSGEVVEVMGAAADVSERKRAENELRETEARFRSFVDHATDGFFVLDEHQAILDVNRQTTECLGYSREEMIGMRPRDYDAGLDAASIAQIGKRVTAGETVTFETLHRRKDGTLIPVEVRARQFQHGARLFRLSLARDITERKRAEDALRRSESYLAEAQRLSHTGTLVFSEVGPVYWSEECYRIWDLNPKHGLPVLETVLERIHPDDREWARNNAFEALRQNRSYVIEYRIVIGDGTVKHLESTGHPFVSLNGEREMVVTTVDVTERKRAQQEHERLRQLESDLAHVNRLSMMGELAASLAHEILHPIATARNNACAGILFLERSPPHLEEVKGMLNCVVRDTDRAKDIVGRMRDHIKKAPPRKEPFDVNEAIHALIGMVQSAISKNGVSVRTILMAGLSPFRGDRVQIQQVVLNLVLNAVEAMSSNNEDRARELSIATERSSTGGILVAVRDSGPGIDATKIDRIFQAFYTTKPSGIGMGLSICQSIIDAHGGRLWATANETHGTTFQFILPADSEDS